MPVTPSRIGLARRRRGLTKTGLAERVGVTVRSIAAFERGDKQPSEATLERIADALEFPPSFFREPDLEEVAVEAASFRALSKMTQSQRDAAFAAGSLAFLVYGWIEERFNLPAVDVPHLSPDTPPEAAAQVVRSEWGMGRKPAPNMIHLLEAHGVRIASLAQDCLEVDAFSMWRRGVPYVFLNNKKSAEHSRFDAAHELGHLVLHGKEQAPQGKLAEAQANAFASAFLMPRDRVLASLRRRSSVIDLVEAKRPFQVSVAALAYRAHQLGIFTDWQYRKICVDLSERGWRRNEPKPIQRESSRVFDQVLRTLRNEGMGIGQIASELHLSRSDLSGLVSSLAMVSVEGGGGAGLAKNSVPQASKAQLTMVRGGQV